jgi:type IV pilus assembly protein PilE
MNLLRRNACGHRRNAGLSLPEVVVCMAIVAIIATYAMPGYRAHLMRSYRVEAVSGIYRVLHYVEQAQRDATGDPDAGAVDPAAARLPPELTQTPQAGAAVYRLSLLGADAENGGYTVQASPSESGAMRGDGECGSYLLDATGRRANRTEAGVSAERVARCWDGDR